MSELPSTANAESGQGRGREDQERRQGRDAAFRPARADGAAKADRRSGALRPRASGRLRSGRDLLVSWRTRVLCASCVAGKAAIGGTCGRHRRCRELPRARHRRHPPVGQAPVHLAARRTGCAVVRSRDPAHAAGCGRCRIPRQRRVTPAIAPTCATIGRCPPKRGGRGAGGMPWRHLAHDHKQEQQQRQRGNTCPRDSLCRILS